MGDHPSIYDDEDELLEDMMDMALGLDALDDEPLMDTSTERRFYVSRKRNTNKKNNNHNDSNKKQQNKNNFFSDYLNFDDDADEDTGNVDLTEAGKSSKSSSNSEGFFSTPNNFKSGSDFMSPDFWDMFESEWGQKVQ